MAYTTTTAMQLLFSLFRLLALGLCVSYITLGCTSSSPSNTVTLVFDVAYSQSEFAVARLSKQLKSSGYELVDAGGHYSIMIQGGQDEMTDEGYTLSVNETDIKIKGNDSNGMLYGTLELAAQLRQYGSLDSIKGRKEQARFPFRAIKYNLPWDSYRRSEALQLHMETCRDLSYWEDFLNMMVENRFNALTLWNLHPFNYLIRPTNFPEATGFSDEELADWQQFWRSLFAMAKERGIRTYIINWNIFVSPEFADSYGGALYSKGETHFTDGDTSATVKQYTKECVTQVINEYPNLTGLGITLGEGMGGMTPLEREQWILDTFMEGIRAADREIEFIHRLPLSAGTGSDGSTDPAVERMTRASLDTLSGVKKPILTELKFNWSHAFSSPKLVKVHGGDITDTYWNPMPENYRLAWMMRNEDFFTLRWGQSDFIREHIRRNGHEYVAGYYVGSECYIPAVNYFDKITPAATYAHQRQWLFYQLWGRLLYQPETSDQLFIDSFTRRYGEVGSTLFDAMRLASNVPLQIASFYNGNWDFTLYSEGMLALSNGQTSPITTEQLISRDPLEPNYLSIPDFVTLIQSGERIPAGKTSPLALADSMEAISQQALQLVQSIDTTNNDTLRYEVADVMAWAHLGQYVAEKLRAATALHTYRQTRTAEEKTKAVQHLQQAVAHWEGLVEVTDPLYRSVPLVHLNGQENTNFHWNRYTDAIRQEANDLANQ
ncbi:MAG: glycoside hydrolase family 20 zincin-like fold domain-containing protein [Bacteroidota bacterium]